MNYPVLSGRELVLRREEENLREVAVVRVLPTGNLLVYLGALELWPLKTSSEMSIKFQLIKS